MEYVLLKNKIYLPHEKWNLILGERYVKSTDISKIYLAFCMIAYLYVVTWRLFITFMKIDVWMNAIMYQNKVI